MKLTMSQSAPTLQNLRKKMAVGFCKGNQEFSGYFRGFLLLAIYLFPLLLMAQKKIKGTLVKKQQSVHLSKGFKRVEVFEMNAADIAQYARGKGKSSFDLTLELSGLQPFLLHLTEYNLLADDYHMVVADGITKQIAKRPTCKTYEGTVLNDPGSTVFLTISDKTINGFIKRGDKQYHIEPLRYFGNDSAVNNFILYEANDVIRNSNLTCGVTEVDEKMAYISGNEIQPLGEANGLCKVTEVGIASDRTMMDKYKSAAMVEEHNISVMNMVVGLYRNAQIGNGYLAFRIKSQYVSTVTAADPLLPAYNGADANILLNRFSEWTRWSRFSSDPDLWQMWTSRDIGLFSGPGQTNFNNSIVGFANLDGVCNSLKKFHILESFTGLSGMSLGILAAHEVGHNFGARHDGDGNAANAYDFIMSPFVNKSATSFSNASLQAMTNYTNTINCLASCTGVIIPEFNASSSAICTGNSITFNNASVTDFPLSSASVWRFPGGNPATSTAVSPTVNYATPGRKAVTLEIGGQSITKEIFVGNAPAKACLTTTSNNVTLTSLFSFSFGSIGYSPEFLMIGGQYDDLACSLNTKLSPGATYLITGGLGYGTGSTPVKSKLQLFLDYNNDGDFLDANERLYTGTNCIYGRDTVLYTAPTNISNTDQWLRLRVVADTCNAPTSDGCSQSANATIIDFAVYFERPPNCVLYVNANARGNNDGSSWSHAFTNLQSAIAAASCLNGTQIWVAKGTYKPTLGTNRDSAFVMKNNVSIYGGFAGTETQLIQRNWAVNATILSGDLGNQGNRTDNSFNVVRNNANGLNSTAVLDGFTVTGGNANKGEYVGNRGAGIFNRLSSPTILNCILVGNSAAEYGGGIFNEAASTQVVNTLLAGNTALFGGGAYNESATPTFINSTFAGNQVSFTGGAFYSFGAPVATILNSIIWGNSSGIQIATVSSNNAVVSNCLVQGGYAPGTNILTGDPTFVIQPPVGLGNLGDLRLLSCSPAINTGNNAFLPVGMASDLRGAPRIAGGPIDMGAYEVQTSGGLIIYVDANATGDNDGTSWANAFTSIEAALNDMNLCNLGSSLTMQIAAGTYTFPIGKNVQVNNLNATILGGYPRGGGASRNFIANPVIIKGDVQVLKSLSMDGVRVEKQ